VYVPDVSERAHWARERWAVKVYVSDASKCIRQMYETVCVGYIRASTARTRETDSHTHQDPCFCVFMGACASESTREEVRQERDTLRMTKGGRGRGAKETRETTETKNDSLDDTQQERAKDRVIERKHNRKRGGEGGGVGGGGLHAETLAVVMNVG